ncbi:hypothetical protein BGI40_01300 [Snodgrassella communis]|jgi:uncharacterized protein|uniref:DUF456 domain-containing protein n=2 Tax=Snodgrassella TaxID=1193515 RepID=A0A2N9XLU3_9NEIS|nr:MULTISPECIES: DUF456 domain-containing protein [Snodgrassella]MCO6505843.1 DUF456 domain-containing protein [Snodgrassella sp.]KDN11829.1 putative membrane protein [Snodgrassella communis]KDN14694.1 putative membrane protein [Snodgrassella communis]PIT07585.1 hypothetical protein BGI29_09410 [Snodgrassella communis]PIT08364.1 hypothetical protein BGI31_07500 [Snodgrassella communis]
MTAVLVILAIVLLLIGLLGTVMPALPGLPLMFGGAWLLALSSDYQIMGAGTLISLGILTILGCTMDYMAGMLGAKHCGASKRAIWGAFIGAIIGMFFAVPGMILGPLLGAAAGEFIARRNLMAAGKVGLATVIGLVLGVVAKIGCAFAMLITIAVMYLYHFINF